MSGGGEAAGTMTVNGKQVSAAGIASIGGLLGSLAIAPQRVVVERNGVIYRRGEGLNVEVAAGDVIEIVHFVGGG